LLLPSVLTETALNEGVTIAGPFHFMSIPVAKFTIYLRTVIGFQFNSPDEVNRKYTSLRTVFFFIDW
jgi:hypothetical protein